MAAESSSSATIPKPTIGILSMGEMGVGVANLLRAHQYNVFTTAAGRSQSTVDRIKAAHVVNLATDEELVVHADIILSIVPPRDANATAQRIVEACSSSTAVTQRSERRGTAATGQALSITFIDLNAISPKSAKAIEAMIQTEATETRRRSSSFSFLKPQPEHKSIPLNFLDGGIIGPPPSLQDKSWKRPSVVISGPTKFRLDSNLSSVLNLKHISDHIGPASALKSCFASLSKGLTALSILSFTTASTCGVLSELQSHLAEFSPAIGAAAQTSLTRMPPKAYRWVDEMTQIGETFSEEGGFGAGLGGIAVFDGISEIYKLVADDTELGKEKTENRKRGRTVEDVTKCMQEGIRKKRRGSGEGDEDLSLTWRGSWS